MATQVVELSPTDIEAKLVELRDVYNRTENIRQLRLLSRNVLGTRYALMGELAERYGMSRASVLRRVQAGIFEPVITTLRGYQLFDVGECDMVMMLLDGSVTITQPTHHKRSWTKAEK